MNQPTYFSLFNLLSQESKHVKHLDHDVHQYFSHFFRRRESDIYPESDEEPFDTFEQVGNCELDGANSHNNLRYLDVNTARKEYQRGAHREKRGDSREYDRPWFKMLKYISERKS